MNQRETGRDVPGVSRKAIESLARELDLPLEQVEKVYRQQAAAIEADARIKQFVPVLVARRVRNELRHQKTAA